ncbi:WD repeat-containing protein 11 isoform X4 [Fagus crenata]
MLSPRPATPSTAVTAAQTTVQDSLDCMLPGPLSRKNFGSANLSPSGLLGFSAGSFVATPTSNSSNSLSPFVTSVRWTPLPLSRDLLSTEPSSSHLLLAVAGSRPHRSLRFLLQIPDPFETDSASSKSGCCFFKYDAAPKYLSCLSVIF